MAKRIPKGRDAKPPADVFLERNMVAGPPKEIPMIRKRNTCAIIAAFVFILITSVYSRAADATFSWTANEVTPSGYKIYYGTESKNYDSVVDVGLPEAVGGTIVSTIDELSDGETYFFAATAYTASEESDYSTEVEYTTPGPNPTDPLVANDLSLQGVEDSVISGTVGTNATAGDSLTFAVASQPSSGTVTFQGSEGAFTFSPLSNFNGDDSFTFTVSNSTETSSPATVTLSISPANDKPEAQDKAIAVNEDGSYSGILSASDIDGDSLTYTLSTATTDGEVVVNGNGTFSYQPQSNYSGSDSFTFTANDGTVSSDVASVTITVSSINDAPIAEPLSVSLSEDSTYSGQVSGSDPDGNSLSFHLVSSVSHGSVNLNTNGSFTYTPDQNYNGTDSFSYDVNDGMLSSTPATVTIMVSDENNAPTATDLEISLDENSSYSGYLSGGDVDGDNLEFSVVSSVLNGTLNIDSDGYFTYSPDTNYSGEDSFTFNVSDGSMTSNIATVDVTITEIAHEFAVELGELQVTSEWQYVDFDTTFVNPAIIVHSTTAGSNAEVLVTIKELTSTGFAIRLNSWDYQNSPDMSETISYLAMEQGYHQLEDDVHVIADCTEISGGNGFQSVMFSSALPTVPVVISSIVSDNDTEGVSLRLQDISQQGFSVAMQEQESSDQTHASEQVCFIAWEKWTGVMDGVLVEVGVLPTTLTDIEATVSFQQQFPEIPITLAGMQSANGMDTATLEITNLVVYEMSLHVLEEQSDNDEIEHTEETAGYFALAPYILSEDSDQDGLSNAEEQTIGTHPGLADSDSDGIFDGDEIAQGSDPTDPDSIPEDPSTIPDNDPSALRFELGETPLTHEPVHIGFSSNFTDPIIIANAVTRNGSSPFNIGITNVSSNGFDLYIREYNYLDGTHPQEIVSYIVMEKGSHILADGSIVEAGLFEASGETTEKFFESQFSVAPVVFTSVVSINSDQTVAGRTWDVNTSSFMHKLQRQESNTTSHGIETVAYLAWTPGVSNADGMKFEVGRTPDRVTHRSYEIGLSQNFTALPFHFAGMQTNDGGDPCLAKITDTEENNLTVRIEEEKSKTSETYHTREIVGFLVVLPE